MLSASVQNTPTLNIAWASQEGLRASAANAEAPKIGEAQVSAQADGSKQPEGRDSQDLRKAPQFTNSYQSQPKQPEIGLSNQALFGLGADHQQDQLNPSANSERKNIYERNYSFCVGGSALLEQPTIGAAAEEVGPQGGPAEAPDREQNEQVENE